MCIRDCLTHSIYIFLCVVEITTGKKEILINKKLRCTGATLHYCKLVGCVGKLHKSKCKRFNIQKKKWQTIGSCPRNRNKGLRWRMLQLCFLYSRSLIFPDNHLHVHLVSHLRNIYSQNTWNDLRDKLNSAEYIHVIVLLKPVCIILDFLRYVTYDD